MKPNLFMRVFNWVILITLPIIILFMLFIGYLAFWPVRIITPNVQPYKVLTPTVKAGDTLIYEVDACKYFDLHSTVYRSFYDSLIYSEPPVTSTITKGCNKTPVTIDVPANLPPGTYHLQIRIIYRVNFIHEQEYNFSTDTFTVTK